MRFDGISVFSHSEEIQWDPADTGVDDGAYTHVFGKCTTICLLRYDFGLKNYMKL